jgi:hypothetical protein
MEAIVSQKKYATEGHEPQVHSPIRLAERCSAFAQGDGVCIDCCAKSGRKVFGGFARDDGVFFPNGDRR